LHAELYHEFALRCHRLSTGIARWLPRAGLRAAAGILVMLLASACASTPDGRDTSDEAGEARPAQATIMVDNDLLPSSSVSVWILWESGRQVLLGSVGPGQRRDLRYEFPSGVVNFRLRARPIGGEDIVSNDFALYNNARVHWALRANVAVVVDGTESRGR